jgi:hypothetical protein
VSIPAATWIIDGYISGGSAFSMIWSHCGFQGVLPSSIFFTPIGMGGAGLTACACEGVANRKLAMNQDVFSAEILTFSVRHSI